MLFFLQYKRYLYAASVCGLLLLSIGYASYKLTESPPVWFDEGIYIQVAQSLAHGGTESLQIAPGHTASAAFVSGGFPFLAPIALSLYTFGDSILAARVPMAVSIVLLCLIGWWFTYRVYGRMEALGALLLLVTFPLLYGNGKNVLGEVPGLVYLFLSLWALWRAERGTVDDYRQYALAGVSVGLCAASKPIFFLFPAAVGGVLLWRLWTGRVSWHAVGVMALAGIVPLALWGYMQFAGGDAAGSVLAHYANPYAEQSVLRTVVGNLRRFVTEATPLYCGMLVGVWALAVGVRTWRKRAISSAEIIAFVFSLLVLAAYLRTAGWYRYFFEAMVCALLFLPVSLRVLADEAREWFPRVKSSVFAVAPIAAVMLFGMFQFYQLNTTSWVAEHYQSHATADLERGFAALTLPADKSVLIYNVPEVVPFLSTKNYYQYFDIDPTGGMAYGKENLAAIEQGVPDMVITSGSNYTEHQSLFVRYSEYDEVGSYMILKRT